MEGVDSSKNIAATAMGLEIHQMDIKTAFLNDKLDVVTYMEHPEGFVQKDREYRICKLRKTFDGMKQSGRAWYVCIHVSFMNKGFTVSHADYTLHILQTCKYIVIVIIYVDDLVILSSNVDKITN